MKSAIWCTLFATTFFCQSIQAQSELKSKEVSVTIGTTHNATISIDNTSRPITIHVWNQPQIKIATTLYYEGDANQLSDAAWLEKLNVNVQAVNSSVKIKSNTASNGNYGNNWAWNGNGNNTAKQGITIYLPKDNKLAIESKYADVSIIENINKLKVNITNGNLETQDVNSLLLESSYGNTSVGNVSAAEIAFINGHLVTKDITELDIDSKYSTVETGTIDKLTLQSTNDDYEIDAVNNFQGRKNYGHLRITKLNNSLVMDGTNADVKIKNITATVTAITIDNKYADLRLPIKNLRNYHINYMGQWSNVYGNFDKQPLQADAFKNLKNNNNASSSALEELKALKNANKNTENNNSDFSATSGDGKSTNININCPNCTVDFK